VVTLTDEEIFYEMATLLLRIGDHLSKDEIEMHNCSVCMEILGELNALGEQLPKPDDAEHSG
jgi:hypothetical protein